MLAIMIVPYAASLSSEFIKMVPSDLKEGAYAMGATRAEVIRRVVFPMAGSGTFPLIFWLSDVLWEKR